MKPLSTLGAIFYHPIVDKMGRNGTIFLKNKDGGGEMVCRKLTDYLHGEGVDFELAHHRTAYTAQEAAGALHVSGKQFAKVVMVIADDRLVILVIPAHHRLNFGKQLNQLLGAKNVRLAKESEFGGLFRERRYGCEVGAMCPFGHLYEFPVYMDAALAEIPNMVFRAGTHRDAIQMAAEDYRHLEQPQMASFSTAVRHKKSRKRKKSWLRRLLGF